MYVVLVVDSVVRNTNKATTNCSVLAQGEHTQREARPNRLTHIDALAATESLGAARKVRKVLGISRVVAIACFSCYSRGIMKAVRRFEESAIV
jgi:hypothetical protein